MHLLPEDVEKICQVKTFVEQHYRDHITYDTITREFHISERKLSMDFKKQFKKTIYQFITEVRIGRAQALLATTHRPIKAIAYMVGYHESNLNRQFKKITGLSPLDWRRQYQEQDAAKSV